MVPHVGARDHPPLGIHASRVLDGAVARVIGGPPLAAATCARHLRLLGADVVELPGPGAGRAEVRWDANAEGAEAEITWYGSGEWGPDAAGSEAVIQARSGLMEVHGRERGEPHRLGLEPASVAAGILAVHGLLAGILSPASADGPASCSTSVLDAALLLMTPYVAMATTPGWTPPGPEATPGPPFPTADGHWVELEVLDPEAWRSFWAQLEVIPAVAGHGWRSFLSRYETATCPLPPELRAATAARPLTQLEALARATQVTLCRLRDPDEVAAEGAGGPWTVRTGTGTGATAARARPALGDARPLAGVRVVEATRRLQGPLAGHILEMLGAAVTRVEPRGGDLARWLPPLAGEVGAVFASLNRHKDAVELDPKQAGDRAALLDLIASADVFLHNWRPGRAGELGLDAEHSWAANPRLIYAHASGWGPGPDRPAVGTDFVVQAHAAMGHFLRPSGERPFPSRLVLVDLFGGLVAAEAVLAGLVLESRTGAGCQVDSSLWGAAGAVEAHALEALREGTHDGRPRWGPLDVPLATAGGRLVVTADSD
ncbi:MAG TPA: CoA transferase, partial [Acidimicrobiales bacterium]|nr:CoA transferase [Acidimicrobiales bacterium]